MSTKGNISHLLLNMSKSIINYFASKLASPSMVPILMKDSTNHLVALVRNPVLVFSFYPIFQSLSLQISLYYYSSQSLPPTFCP